MVWILILSFFALIVVFLTLLIRKNKQYITLAQNFTENFDSLEEEVSEVEEANRELKE